MNKDKIILDLCGGTGAWSRPYKEVGYDVRIATLPNFDVCDWRNTWLSELVFGNKVYGILAAPPCTMFSFARTRAKKPRDVQAGMEIVIACLNIIWECQYGIKSDQQRIAPLKFWALENPFCMLNWFLGKPAFIFQPYEFGADYSKKTCLWGTFKEPKVLPLFVNKPTKDLFHRGLMKDIKTISKLDSWKDTKTRQEIRSITPQGFAKAFYSTNK